MTEDEAVLLVAKVFGAWPDAAVGEATVEIWVEKFTGFAYVEAAREAVDRLIDSERFRPSLALVKEEYMRHRDRYLPRGLPEPDVTAEERQEVAGRLREMLGRLERSMTAEREERRREHAAEGLARTKNLIRRTDPGWRADGSWRLVEWDKEALPRRRLTDRPPADAELAGDGLWASVYVSHRIAATWRRVPGEETTAP